MCADDTVPFHSDAPSPASSGDLSSSAASPCHFPWADTEGMKGQLWASRARWHQVSTQQGHFSPSRSGEMAAKASAEKPSSVKWLHSSDLNNGASGGCLSLVFVVFRLGELSSPHCLCFPNITWSRSGQRQDRLEASASMVFLFPRVNTPLWVKHLFFCIFLLLIQLLLLLCVSFHCFLVLGYCYFKPWSLLHWKG